MSAEKSFFYRLCLVVDAKKYKPFIEHFLDILKKNSYDIIEEKHEDKLLILLSQTNQDFFYIAAQNTKIRKIALGEKKTEAEELGLNSNIIHQEKKKPFIFAKKDNFSPDQNFYDQYPEVKKNDERWGLGMFTENEMLYLETKILTDIPVQKEGFLAMCKYNDELKDKISDFEYEIQTNKSLFNLMLKAKIIEDYFPLHVSNFKENVYIKTISSLKCPHDTIRSYYGDKVAIYFAWIFHYSNHI